MSNTSSPVLEKKRPLENNGLMDTSQTPANDENDPCLKTGNKKSGKFYERTEVTLREKTGLSRRGLIVSGIVLLVLLFLFITVVVLVICWPRTPHERQFPICEDAACLRAVSQIREGLNKSISPCEDVVEWGCGNWLRTHSIPLESNHWSQRAIMYRQELKWIHELISTLPQQMDHKSVKYKIKRFYDACMNVESVEADGVNTLLRRINELGKFFFAFVE